MTVTIFSLPDELLLCIVSADAEQLEWSGRQAPLHWTISHVCRRFRDVVVGALTLWSKFETQLTNPASCKISDLYIERSRACTLSVTLRHNINSDNHHNELRLVSLLSHSNRIQRLTIVSNLLGIKEIVAAFRDAAAASLQCLQIEVHAFTQYDGLFDMFTSGAPLLRSLKLSRFRLPDAIPPWMASIVDLDWAQSTFSPRVVAHFPSLRHLTIDWHSCSEPIQLPSLTSLCLFLEDGEGDAPVLAETLGRFTVPALTDLSGQNIHGDHIPALFDSTHIAKSWSAVTSLVFTGRHPDCDCEEEGSTYLPKPISSPPLRAFPAVTSLSLIDVCYTAKIVRDIFRPDFALWPLRTVTIGTPACLANVDDLYSALTDAVRAARLQKREIPKFRLSPALFCLPYWQENNVDVELFEGLHFSL